MVAAFTTVVPEMLTPVPLMARFAPARKLLPVSVTATVVPRFPLEGEMPLKTGAGGMTVKVTAPLVPPEVVTDTVCAPVVALEAITRVAVIVEALTTFTPETVMPEALAVTVAPAMKLLPVKVTGTLVPCRPLVTEIEFSTGAAAVTAKFTEPEVPPAVDTDTV